MIPDALRLAGVEVREQQVGTLAVYAPTAFHGHPRRPLDRTGWQVEAWPRGDEAWKALDRDRRTRWTSGGPQRPGLWFRVDLGRDVLVNGVLLDLGPYTGDFPRTLAVEVSLDGDQWRTVAATLTSFRPGVIVRGQDFRLFNPLIREPSVHDPRNSPDVRFPAARVRFLRLSLPIPPGGTFRTEFDWSIAELVVFAPPADG